MAMDFRIRSDFTFEMGVLFPKQILAVFQVILIINQALASPVWMPQFLSGDHFAGLWAAVIPEDTNLVVFRASNFKPKLSLNGQLGGHGRNIRHLPCVSRRTGEQGICMFAYTCMKSNGTHLGTCIDRFYFGSCCKLKESNNDLLIENHINLINNNQVSSPFYPDDSKIQNSQTTSLQNLYNNKFTVSNAASNYPYKSTTPKVETSTQLTSTDNTIVDLAQHLATETYFLTPSTEKIYIPIYTSLKPNKTENLSSSSGLFTTLGSSSGISSDIKRPTTQSQLLDTTTQSYFLSTFQVVHEGSANKTPMVTSPTKITTLRPITEVVTTWTPVKPAATTYILKKNTTTIATTKPPSSTTQNKPTKPVKPITTTRKPPSKKPTTKPVVKPVTTTAKPATTPVKKPVQTTTNKVTTTKPVVPVKKPTQPTKKPIVSSPKPTTVKPTATPKPLVSSSKPTSTSGKPTSAKPATTTKPVTAPKTTTTSPLFSTIIQTTSEVVFTKPGIPSSPFSTPPTLFGITTFRPDLTGTTKRPELITGPYLTTFNYVSEGIKETTPRPVTRPASSSSTISNEISSSETIFGNFPEAQEENTNIIFQQAGSTIYPGSTKPGDSSIPFFPEATKPGSTKPPWIQIVQSTTPESTVSTTAKTTSTTTRTSTYVPIFAGLNISDYTQVCGRRLFPESRVVGGEKSTFGKWPWQISLRQWRTSTYLHKCGAALLNENWAITAAHCVENVPPSDLLLRLGEHDLSTEDEPYGFQERRVQIVASHPQFDPRTFEYDLALLRFYEPVKFQPNIIPVCVPEDSTNFVGQTAYVTGWGRLYEDGPLPSVLQEVSVPVINNTLCENMYRSAGYIEHIPEIFICAGWKKGGFDSCEGDSGGPMVIQRPDKRWLLAGVISWGIGCAEPNQPGVYTRISEFREWIHQILQF